ncbi:MAG: hypothetical protein KME28_15405 [Pelatocladus maniniholoensis HA4357-MV3]|uniref:Uncharacterized protein n=1 Tax=Pelatocladus maniniholoensis HA4357-MV3 TaxID=1117104 RepID=A0A9E3HAI7_9NOST|nr:hypothetical protein [Pelatocladus maniniholoensis HA4357-MV3]
MLQLAELQAKISSKKANRQDIQSLARSSAALEETTKEIEALRETKRAIEIANPEKDIQKTSKRLKALNDELSSVLEQLQKKLSSGLVQAIESATREIVNVGNLPQPTKGQLVIEKQALASEKEARKASEVGRLKRQKAQQANTLPPLYVDAVQSVARIVTGQNLPAEKIPTVVPSAEVAGRGDYLTASNTYRIRPDLYQKL